MFLQKLPPWTLTVVTVAAVLYLTLFPDPVPTPDEPLWEHMDKVVHAVMMAGVYWATELDSVRSKLHQLRIPARIWLFAAVIAFGGAIELAQGAMQMGRGADWLDFGADTIGSLLAMLIPAGKIFFHRY